MEAVWVPIFAIVFMFGGTIAIVALSLRYKARKLEHDEIMKAIENGQTPPTIEIERRYDFFKDLRWGIILAASGLGFFIFMREGSYDMSRLAGIGMIPTLIGIGMIILSLVTKHIMDEKAKENDKSDTSK